MSDHEDRIGRLEHLVDTGLRVAIESLSAMPRAMRRHGTDLDVRLRAAELVLVSLTQAMADAGVLTPEILDAAEAGAYGALDLVEDETTTDRQVFGARVRQHVAGLLRLPRSPR